MLTYLCFNYQYSILISEHLPERKSPSATGTYLRFCTQTFHRKLQLSPSPLQRISNRVTIRASRHAQVGSSVEDSTVGSGCAIEVRARLAAGASAGDNCCVGAGAELRGSGPAGAESLPSGTSLSAPCGLRVPGRDAAAHRAHAAALLDILRDRLPRAAELAAAPWAPPPPPAAAAAAAAADAD
jgi:hypothetical protein